MDFGLEQAGIETIWQVEYDDWCREVALPQNFPHTEKFKDVREVGKWNLQPVDLICGGFPCQDISSLNSKRKGLEGERSGLWYEYYRIIRELQPRYALIENVTELSNQGLVNVLSDLAKIGFDAEWQDLQASDFGLPMGRKRLFIFAYSNGNRQFQTAFFSRIGYQAIEQQNSHKVFDLHLESFRRSYPQIPEHLRMDNGTAFELSEIERAVKAYGNGVAVPVARWLGERILEFDNR